MTSTVRSGLLAAAVLIAATPSLAAGADSLSRVEKVSTQATVKSVDPATRHVVLVTASGETAKVKVPDDSRALQTLKPGDIIKATYARETEIVISDANKPLPKDAATLVAKRSAETAPRGGVIGTHLVVSGAVLAVDTKANTLKVSSPKGGEVHTIAVKRPEGQKALAKLKPGDRITAYVTEALLITAAPQ